VCKSAIALYCLCNLSVIKRVCNQVLINPIIWTRTRHFVTCPPPYVWQYDNRLLPLIRQLFLTPNRL
jgi:hypothetical protein